MDVTTRLRVYSFIENSESNWKRTLLNDGHTITLWAWIQEIISSVFAIHTNLAEEIDYLREMRLEDNIEFRRDIEETIASSFKLLSLTIPSQLNTLTLKPKTQFLSSFPYPVCAEIPSRLLTKLSVAWHNINTISIWGTRLLNSCWESFRRRCRIIWRKWEANTSRKQFSIFLNDNKTRKRLENHPKCLMYFSLLKNSVNLESICPNRFVWVGETKWEEKRSVRGRITDDVCISKLT